MKETKENAICIYMFHLCAGTRNMGYNSVCQFAAKSQVHAGALVVYTLSFKILYVDIKVLLSTRLCFRAFTDYF